MRRKGIKTVQGTRRGAHHDTQALTPPLLFQNGKVLRHFGMKIIDYDVHFFGVVFCEDAQQAVDHRLAVQAHQRLWQSHSFLVQA